MKIENFFLIFLFTSTLISSSKANCFCDEGSKYCSIKNITLDYFKKAFSGNSIACYTKVNNKNVSYYYSSFTTLELENFTSDIYPKIILQKLQVGKLIIKNSPIKTIEDDAFTVAETYRRSSISIDLSFNNLQKVNLKSFYKGENGYKINLFVSLENNKITEIVNFPNGTGRFYQMLNFANNLLKSVKIGNSVNNLNFSFNEISEISCLENVGEVETLDLSNNLLVKSENFYDCMARMKNLKALNLSFNNLAKVNGKEEPLRLQTFTELSMLESLSLAGSQMSTIPYGLFSRLENLKFLDLSYNKFETLDFKRLLQLTNLNTLDLGYNNFQSINNFLDIKTYLKNLVKLGLEGSEFYCERLAFLLMNLIKNNVSLMDAKKFVKSEPNINGIKCDEE